MQARHAWRTAGHQGPRTVNADAVAMADGVVALADGVGDSADAARAALTAVNAAVRVPAVAGPVAALSAAHDALTGEVTGEVTGGGDAVLVVAQPYAGGYHIGWVGDVRAYAWDGADLWQLTSDHTLAQYLRDRGGVPTPRMEHVVTTSVRTSAPVHYGLTSTGAAHVLLTTDGVHKTLSHAAMTAILRQAANPADALVLAAVAAGTGDNTTAVVLSRAPVPAVPVVPPTTPLPAAA